MKISCNKCQCNFSVPDEKLPPEQVVFLPCPRCKTRLTVDTRTSVLSMNDHVPSAAELVDSLEKTLIEAITSSNYDASEKPFDFLEPGIETALICEHDSKVLAEVRSKVKLLGYHTVEPDNAAEALKKMRFHTFDLIVINETFGSSSPDDNPLLTYLEGISIAIRRNIFVALISNRFRTMDNMAAFNKSVNVVIELRNINEIDKILRRAMEDNQAFYSVFKESLITTGRG